jgi:hypothetical protein
MTMEVAQMRRRTAVTVAAVALIVLTGCSANPSDSVGAAPTSAGPATATAAGGSPTAGSGAASPTPAANPKAAYEAQLVEYGRQLAQCARTHGLPRFPDPVGVVYDESGVGDARFPGVDKGDFVTAMDRCPEITRRIPHPPPPGPPSAATLQKMRQYAQCMRQHGASGFPDPRADGTFPIRGTRFAGVDRFSAASISDAVINANLTCRGYQRGWYPRAS